MPTTRAERRSSSVHVFRTSAGGKVAYFGLVKSASESDAYSDFARHLAAVSKQQAEPRGRGPALTAELADRYLIWLNDNSS